MPERYRPARSDEGIVWRGRARPFHATETEHEAMRACLGRSDRDLNDLDLAARMLGAEDDFAALKGLRLLEKVLAG